MANLYSILKEFEYLNKMEKVFTYKFLAKYYNIGMSKELIEKRIDAIDERKIESEIDDNIFDTFIHDLNLINGRIKTPLFQRQTNRNLLQSPEVIKYTLIPPLYESKERKSSRCNAIRQKKLAEKEADKGNRNRYDCFTTINHLSQRPFTVSRISNKLSRLANSRPRLQLNNNFATVSPGNINLSTQKCLKTKSYFMNEYCVNSKNCNKTRNAFNHPKTSIIPLNDIGSVKIEDELNVNKAYSNQNKDRVYYEEIARDFINPIKSFTIQNPHYPVKGIRDLYTSKPSIKLQKGKIKDYLVAITLKKSKSNKKKMTFILSSK